MASLKITALIVHYIFLSFIFLSVEVTYLNESSVYTNIQASIGKLCPYSNICGWKLRPANIPTDAVPCCRECSCEDDLCKANENCCFQGQRISHTDVENQTIPQCGPDCRISSNKENVTMPEIGTTHYSCVLPVVLDSFNSGHQKSLNESIALHRLYKMITTCPYTSSTASSYDVNNTQVSPETNLDCGERNVASWGSLFRMYSPATRRIYKNYLCAECHNVTDGLIWDVKQTCEVEDNDVSDIMQDFAFQPTGDVLCSKVFIFPGQSTDIEHLRCYRDIINECNKDFEVPPAINLTADEIRAACKSIFYSPIHGRTPTENHFVTYKNVYCALCNSGRNRKTEYCENKNFQLRSGDDSFTFILKGTFVVQNTIINNMKSRRVVCPSTWTNTQNSSECRELLCPSGQIRTIEGECEFPTVKWSSELSICLELTPKRNVSLSVFKEMTTKGIDAWLVSPWNDLWTINEVVYQTVSIQSLVFIKRLFVHLKFAHMAHDIKRQMQYVKSILSAKWKLKVDVTTVILMDQTFSRFCYFYVKLGDQHCSLPLHEVNSLRESVRSVDAYLNSQSVCNYKIVMYRFERVKFSLTKLFFCNLIQLKHSEFELKAKNLILEYKPTNTVFLSNEFSLTRGESPNEQGVRLCATDAGFKSKQTTNGNRAYQINKTLIALFAISVVVWKK